MRERITQEQHCVECAFWRAATDSGDQGLCHYWPETYRKHPNDFCSRWWACDRPLPNTAEEHEWVRRAWQFSADEADRLEVARQDRGGGG